LTRRPLWLDLASLISTFALEIMIRMLFALGYNLLPDTGPCRSVAAPHFGIGAYSILDCLEPASESVARSRGRRAYRGAFGALVVAFIPSLRHLLRAADDRVLAGQVFAVRRVKWHRSPVASDDLSISRRLPRTSASSPSISRATPRCSTSLSAFSRSSSSRCGGSCIPRSVES
jgi:hypothetical protein